MERRSPRLLNKKKTEPYKLDPEEPESSDDSDFSEKEQDSEEYSEESEEYSEESEDSEEISKESPVSVTRKRKRADSFELGLQPNITFSKTFEDKVAEIISRVHEKEEAKLQKKNPELKKISDFIKMKKPKLTDVLEINLPIEMKSNLYERIKFLELLEPYCPEYAVLRNYINSTVDWGKTAKDSTNEEVLKEIEVRDHMYHRIPTNVDIVNSNLSLEHKAVALDLYDSIHEADLTSAQRRTNIEELIEYMEKNRKEIPPKYSDLIKELDKINDEDTSLIIKILELDVPLKTKSFIYKKYQEMKVLPAKSEGKHNAREWLNTVVSLPFGKVTKVNPEITPFDHLFRIKEELNKSVYGMHDTKEAISRIFCQWLANPQAGNYLALQGPPGVGKTEVLRSLSEAIGRPLKQINLGGAKDASYLTGHSFTYIDSKPGRIVECLVQAQCSDFILYFDEIDKIGESPYGQEVSGVLTHIIDKTQNKTFNDQYLSGIDIDLSNIFMVFAFNDPKRIDPIVLDRMPVIIVPGYDIDEKGIIVRDFLIPKILKRIGMNPQDVTLTPEAIRKLILRHLDNKKGGDKTGIRSLEKDLNEILERVNVLRLVPDPQKQRELNLQYTLNFPFKIPCIIDSENLERLLTEKELEWNTMYN